ncbi:hypothetical protein HMPREF0322_04458 [Desulfitobacterium hafniense DP7]|uniref:Uncharacterized protein n=1 Tax=Desulfitobacterium hafniense DP7 TaxID=537010 RepID=G9XU00_DESHA|nr:hypothetical protein HMPREF0322_04458 [Desulfitobacterium hafniense DP7]
MGSGVDFLLSQLTWMICNNDARRKFIEFPAGWRSSALITK